MAPVSAAAVSLSVPFLPPRHNRRTLRCPSPRIRASSDTKGAVHGERKVGALERTVSDLRSLVASLPPAVAVARRNIRLNVVAGICFGIPFLVAVARHIIIRNRERAHRGSVADLVSRGQLKSGRRGVAKARLYNNPFNNPLVKIDEGTSTAQMFGKEYRLAPVKLTKEQQAMHQQRRSHAYQWRRPTVFLKEGESMPADVDPDTVRWIPANHPFAAASSEIDEETAKQNIYQKDGVPSRIKAEHEAMQKRLEASKNVPEFPSSPINMPHGDRPFRLSGESLLGNLQEHPESGLTVKNQNNDLTFESDKDSFGESLRSKKLEGQ